MAGRVVFSRAVKRAFLFDLDGTITDTDVLWATAMARTLASLGCEVTPQWAMQTVIGRAWRSIYADITGRFPALAAYPSPVLAHMSEPFFRQLVAECDVAIPGSVALVRRLAAAGELLAVVSGSTREQISEALRLAKLEGAFRAIVSSDDVSNGKPDPEGYLAAARLLGAEPRDCTVFEDSAAGVRAGKAAGMRVVALHLPDHPPQDVSAADAVLSDLSLYDPDR